MTQRFLGKDPGSGPATRIALRGTYNLRDVGASLAPGGLLRPNRLFRSDSLHGLNQAGREALASLGIRTVVDLRDHDERWAAPSHLERDGFAVVHAPVFSGTAWSFIARRIGLEELYRVMVQQNGAGIAGAVEAIALADPGAVVVHCTAGKDRTGLVVAMSLLSAGVPRSHVVADYALSETNLSEKWINKALAALAKTHGHDFEARRELIGGSPAHAIESALGMVDAQWGGARSYLAAHGVAESTLDALRRRLTA